MRRVVAFIERLEHRTFLSATLFRDLGPGESHGVPRELTTFDDHLYFVVAYRPSVPGGSGAFGYLWRTDGTPAGTEQFGPAPSPQLLPGAPTNMQGWVPSLQFYDGAWSVTTAGDKLWFYNVAHEGGGANLLRVTLHGIDRNDNIASYDLGIVNLSNQQNVHDLQNVNGQLYFYRDGDRSDPNPANRVGYWWTLSNLGQLVSTGVSDPGAFLGRGPARLTSNYFNGLAFFAYEEEGSIGRELYVGPALHAASAAAGTVTVTGTPGDDIITIARRGGRENLVEVVVNGQSFEYPFEQLTRIRANLGDGNDRLTVSEADGIFTIPVSVVGGAGNDIIITASGRDTLYGGDGDDSLYGGADNDYLWGQAGNDRLNGGGGRDILWGGPGFDTFVSSHLFERRDLDLDDLLR